MIQMRTALAILVLILGSALSAHAGGFIFAGESNGVDVITHPTGYTGTGGTLSVSVCIDPASPNAADMEISLQNIVTTINDLQAVSPNLIFGGSNDIPSGQIDFESVALHEVGHCIGLAHPNLGSQSGVTSTNSTNSTNGANNTFNEGNGGDGIFGSPDDARGDDLTLHWFRTVDNNPFNLGTVFDTSTYSRSLADLPGGDTYAANADRTVGSNVFGVTNTEAVMQQGSGSDEDQRELMADDVATLSLGMSGLDETQGTADDYTIELTYAGLTDSCDVLLRFNNAATGFAVCSVSGSFVGDHVRITSATASFNTNFSWFFNDTLKTGVKFFDDGFESGGTEEWSTTVP